MWDRVVSPDADPKWKTEADLRKLIPEIEAYLRHAEHMGDEEELVAERQSRHQGRVQIEQLLIRKIPPSIRWFGFPIKTRLSAWIARRLKFVRQFYTVSVADVTEDRKRDRRRVDLDALVTSLANAIEIRDHLTAGHIERVSAYAQRLGQQSVSFGWLPESDLETLYYASILHDVGKIGVPDAILNKPGPLTSEEFDWMKRHTHYGLQMLTRYGDGILSSYAAGVLHHERMDGKGYPYGLKGDQIPMVARVIAVADVWDALTSDRPYRRRFPVNRALGILRECREDHLDPRLVDIFIDKELYVKVDDGRQADWPEGLPEVAAVLETPGPLAEPIPSTWYVRKVGQSE